MKHYQFLSVAHAALKYGQRTHAPEELQKGRHGGVQGWRERYAGRPFPLPPAADLQSYEGDDRLDPRHPRTRHVLREALGGSFSGDSSGRSQG